MSLIWGGLRIEEDCEVAACSCAELLLFPEDVLQTNVSGRERMRSNGNEGAMRSYPCQRGNVGVECQALGCRSFAVRVHCFYLVVMQRLGLSQGGFVWDKGREAADDGHRDLFCPVGVRSGSDEGKCAASRNVTLRHPHRERPGRTRPMTISAPQRFGSSARRFMVHQSTPRDS